MYKKFEELLKKHNVTAYRVAKETGIATATLTQWKNGTSVPKTDKLQKIADYFKVPLEYFSEKSDITPIDNELSGVYFSLAKNAQDEGIDPDDILMAINMIKALKKKGKESE